MVVGLGQVETACSSPAGRVSVLDSAWLLHDCNKWVGWSSSAPLPHQAGSGCYTRVLSHPCSPLHPPVHHVQILPPSLAGRAKVFGNELALKTDWVMVDLPYFCAPGGLQSKMCCGIDLDCCQVPQDA